MKSLETTFADRFRWRSACPLACALIALLGCQERTVVEASDPQLSAFIELMIPQKIELQHYLTKPISINGEGNADGLEIVLAVMDSFGDPAKTVGTFHFELYTMRMASADKLDKRVAFWQVQINSDQTLIDYWDRLSRYYCFRVTLPDKLKPGKYVLIARLISPTGDKLTDEYQLAYDGEMVATAPARR